MDGVAWCVCVNSLPLPLLTNPPLRRGMRGMCMGCVWCTQVPWMCLCMCGEASIVSTSVCCVSCLCLLGGAGGPLDGSLEHALLALGHLGAVGVVVARVPFEWRAIDGAETHASAAPDLAEHEEGRHLHLNAYHIGLGPHFVVGRCYDGVEHVRRQHQPLGVLGTLFLDDLLQQQHVLRIGHGRVTHGDHALGGALVAHAAGADDQIALPVLVGHEAPTRPRTHDHLGPAFDELLEADARARGANAMTDDGERLALVLHVKRSVLAVVRQLLVLLTHLGHLECAGGVPHGDANLANLTHVEHDVRLRHHVEMLCTKCGQN
mmetsp:Transcript_4956/g.11594  ORF Transcript_4956/g.11594 Transcript_4956/m.11594 type:complete len:320 (-) Transcript_4956:27-986(-)